MSPSIVADLAAPIGPVLSGNFHDSHWVEGLLYGTAFKKKNSIGCVWGGNGPYLTLIGLGLCPVKGALLEVRGSPESER